MPTNVTTTNLNNVHVHTGNNKTTSDEGGDYGLGSTVDGSCCIVVRAKTCAVTTSGPKCQHRRHKTCDDEVCTAPVMHAQTRRRCDRKGVCHKKIVYIPEPGPQKCVNIDQWPHVVCGTLVQGKRNCEGCYDHYGYGYQNYHGKMIKSECRGCFDDAWDEGQRYRRGPVLRPFYYHQPPCYLIGTCVPYDDCGYGCYGDEFLDPAWGTRPHRGHADRDIYYEDEIDDSGEFEDENSTNSTTDSGEFVKETIKCKMVSGNGTIVRNCTDNGLDGNEFAKEPNVNFVDDISEGTADEFDLESRYRRHDMPRFHNRFVRRTQYDLDDSEKFADTNKRVPLNTFADDFEYDAEMDHPYKRARRPHARRPKKHRRQKKHRRSGRGHGRDRRLRGKKRSHHNTVVDEVKVSE